MSGRGEAGDEQPNLGDVEQEDFNRVDDEDEDLTSVELDEGEDDSSLEWSSNSDEEEDELAIRAREEEKEISRLVEAFQAGIFDRDSRIGLPSCHHLDFQIIASDRGRKIVIEALQSNRTINSLILTILENNISKDFLDSLAFFLGNTRSVTSITLVLSNSNGNQKSDDSPRYGACIRQLAEAITNNNCISELNIETDGVDLPRLFAMPLTPLHKLKSLSLGGVPHRFDGRQIAQFIKDPTCGLSKLSIDTTMSKGCLAPILEGLKEVGTNCSLKDLQLDFPHDIGVTKSVQLLANNLAHMTNFVSIRFSSRVGASKPVEDVLAKGLFKNCSVEVITLYNFSEDFKSLAKFISKRNRVSVMMNSPLYELITKKDILRMISSFAGDQEHGFALVFFILQNNAGVVFGS